MAVLSTQQLSQSGVTPTMSAASSSGDEFLPTSQTILRIANSDTSSHTATVTVTATDYGQPVANITITIPPSSYVLAGPYDPGEVADPSTGLASIGYSDAAVLTVAVIEL